MISSPEDYEFVRFPARGAVRVDGGIMPLRSDEERNTLRGEDVAFLAEAASMWSFVSEAGSHDMTARTSVMMNSMLRCAVLDAAWHGLLAGRAAMAEGDESPRFDVPRAATVFSGYEFARWHYFRDAKRGSRWEREDSEEGEWSGDDSDSDSDSDSGSSDSGSIGFFEDPFMFDPDAPDYLEGESSDSGEGWGANRWRRLAWPGGGAWLESGFGAGDTIYPGSRYPFRSSSPPPTWGYVLLGNVLAPYERAAASAAALAPWRRSDVMIQLGSAGADFRTRDLRVDLLGEDLVAAGRRMLVDGPDDSDDRDLSRVPFGSPACPGTIWSVDRGHERMSYCTPFSWNELWYRMWLGEDSESSAGAAPAFWPDNARARRYWLSSRGGARFWVLAGPPLRSDALDFMFDIVRGRKWVLRTVCGGGAFLFRSNKSATVRSMSLRDQGVDGTVNLQGCGPRTLTVDRWPGEETLESFVSRQILDYPMPEFSGEWDYWNDDQPCTATQLHDIVEKRLRKVKDGRWWKACPEWALDVTGGGTVCGCLCDDSVGDESGSWSDSEDSIGMWDDSDGDDSDDGDGGSDGDAGGNDGDGDDCMSAQDVRDRLRHDPWEVMSMSAMCDTGYGGSAVVGQEAYDLIVDDADLVLVLPSCGWSPWRGVFWSDRYVLRTVYGSLAEGYRSRWVPWHRNFLATAGSVKVALGFWVFTDVEYAAELDAEDPDRQREGTRVSARRRRASDAPLDGAHPIHYAEVTASLDSLSPVQLARRPGEPNPRWFPRDKHSVTIARVPWTSVLQAARRCLDRAEPGIQGLVEFSAGADLTTPTASLLADTAAKAHVPGGAGFRPLKVDGGFISGVRRAGVSYFVRLEPEATMVWVPLSDHVEVPET